MERADLLSWGLMFAAEGMLVLWTAVLLTAAVLVLGPFAKIRTRRCYNFIYNSSWCRRAYVPSSPT